MKTSDEIVESLKEIAKDWNGIVTLWVQVMANGETDVEVAISYAVMDAEGYPDIPQKQLFSGESLESVLDEAKEWI